MSGYFSQADFNKYWAEQNDLAVQPRPVEAQAVDFSVPGAIYRELTFPAVDGTSLHARFLCPVSEGPVPTVLMYHDYGRGVRGWHHMTRFLALGYGVVALENRPGPVDVTAGWRQGVPTAAYWYADALTAGHVARSLPEVDGERLLTWGEGLGGALAIAAAAYVPGAGRCAAYDPLPTDFPALWAAGCAEGLFAGVSAYLRERDPQHREAEDLFRALGYLDVLGFAQHVACPALVGSGQMSPVTPLAGQQAVAQAAKARHVVYPKHTHERVNDFEDQVLKFFLL
jgi:cephalosporin-C deacetylase-like acetyl esterase